MSVNPASEVLPYIKSGKIRAIGTSGLQRSKFVPDVPTFVEAGYKDVVVEAWNGFFAPAKTPAGIVGRINAAVNNALASEDLAQTLAKAGTEPLAMSPDQFARRLRVDIDKWAPVVRASGFTAED
jgi:tripartite-type tricarboxylate transporter receptor subunit TctC